MLWPSHEVEILVFLFSDERTRVSEVCPCPSPFISDSVKMFHNFQNNWSKEFQSNWQVSIMKVCPLHQKLTCENSVGNVFHESVCYSFLCHIFMKWLLNTVLTAISVISLENYLYSDL